ncbi:unnamed protein product [[Candida] boidinii]|nr:hypothetical protein B5S30_g919 [[Candida] boidinii]OWB84565.1 hypothetical protein B5S33_g3214 [[Candida] boidinii]GME87184.1 unnamed protein product [[Candida] boidinii]GMG00246.1 unnamed protein product [[Candida] boidinii]
MDHRNIELHASNNGNSLIEAGKIMANFKLDIDDVWGSGQKIQNVLYLFKEKDISTEQVVTLFIYSLAWPPEIKEKIDIEKDLDTWNKLVTKTFKIIANIREIKGEHYCPPGVYRHRNQRITSGRIEKRQYSKEIRTEANTRLNFRSTFRPNTYRSSSDIKCYYCQQIGHPAKKCNKKKADGLAKNAKSQR